jgi:hypothetical protein
MRLNQISGSDELSRMVVSEVMRYAPVLNYLHFFTKSGIATIERKAADSTEEFQVRAFNSEFASKVTAAVEYATLALKIYGRDLRVDIAYEETGSDIPSEFKRQLLRFGRALGGSFNDILINSNATGTIDQTRIVGLKRQVDEIMTSVPTQDKIFGGANGNAVPAGNSDSAKKAQQEFVEALLELTTRIDGGADCILMNGRLLARLTTIAKELCDTQLNEFGVPITFFNRIPVIDAGYNQSGGEVLPFTETVGTSTNANTSVYAFKSGEASDVTLFTSQNGLKVYPMARHGNSFYETRVEFLFDLAVLNPRSVARLRGIRLA